MNNFKLCPNFEEAKKFLSIFGPVTQVETFQTFYDPKDKLKKDLEDIKKITRVIHRNFSSTANCLARLNNQSAGIFYNPNQTDLLGRRKSNIVRVRVVYCDVDDGLERYFPIKPSAIIKTKNGYHYYFLIEGYFPLEIFELMLQSIIKTYKTDKSVCDISRVMRLPGFFHVKDVSDPFLIFIKEFNPDLRYTFDELKVAFPIEEIAEKKKKANQILTKNSNGMLQNEVNKYSLLKNVINGGCPALKRVWDKENVPHRERVAIMSMAIRTSDGESLLFNRWPSDKTIYQIENAKKNNLLPWSCRKLQEEGVCLKGDPLFGDRCFLSRNGHEPSPMRLAFGISRAFKINGEKNE